MTTNSATEHIYNLVLASGKAKEIAKQLSINYATFMREINIYDKQAKLGIQTFLRLLEIFNDFPTVLSIAQDFSLDIITPENHAIPHWTDADIDALIHELSTKLKAVEDKAALVEYLNKSYVRLLKEVNIYDPSAKLGIDTFLTCCQFLGEAELVARLLSYAGYNVKISIKEPAML